MTNKKLVLSPTILLHKKNSREASVARKVGFRLIVQECREPNTSYVLRFSKKDRGSSSDFFKKKNYKKIISKRPFCKWVPEDVYNQKSFSNSQLN